MTTLRKGEFVLARSHAKLGTKEVILLLRELKGWTQDELSRRCGISATNISLLEHGKVDIGKRRAVQIAKAFGVHPAIIMFPEYEGGAMGDVA